MTFTVAILAGGQARRLHGVDKGLQLLHGRPLIESVLDVVATMSVPRDGGNAAETHLLILANRNIEKYSTFGISMPDDADCGDGPLAGVATALRACRSTWLLTVPVDCPNPPRELLSRLYSNIGRGSCAVAHDGERRQPLFALYRSDVATSACVAARAGQGPREWHAEINAFEVDFGDQRSQFANLNSPTDFADYEIEPRPA
ncbi:MAG: molybdenum cofactor guanylyltransferase [Dokdonella sp.]